MVLEFSLILVVEEGGGVFHPRPSNPSTPPSLLSHVVLKFHVFSENGTTYQHHSLCVEVCNAISILLPLL